MAARRRKNVEPDFAEGGFIEAVMLVRERVPNFNKYPFSLPVVRNLETLELHPKVTFLIGENGSGKSTLIEAIAVAAGFNAEGGSKNFNFATRRTESALHDALRCRRGIRREMDGFFLRAESFYNVATEVDKRGVSGYGSKSLHAQSHGESFLALATHRFRDSGLYIMDEPESALSPARQLALLRLIHFHVEDKKSQFLIATHSPLLMAYPDALIYHLSEQGIQPIAYEETEHFQITRDFLNNRESYLHYLFSDRESQEGR
jgi:predicted ATPase